MSNRLRFAASGCACLAAAFLASAPSPAQSCDAGWQCNVSYGASTAMDLYVPKLPAAVPPIVVVLHYCGGNAQAVHSWLQSYSDQDGFALIAPTAGGNCFDATPTRAGERANIAAMVAYVVAQKTADPKRVYVMGASSGACMTQALLAAYPDVFAAGSSLAGVPAGAWTGGNNYAWSTTGNGMPTTAEGWGDIVRNADKGFTGTRPRVQLWHGMGDTTLTYSQTYPFEVEQWTNVFGVSAADATTTNVKPAGAEDTWARTSYADGSGTVVVEANSGPMAADHDLASRGLWGDVVRFFGLDLSSAGSGGMSGAGAGGVTTGGQANGTGGMANAGGKNAGGIGGALGIAGADANTGGSRATFGGATNTGGAAAFGGATNTGGAMTFGGATNTAGVQSVGGFTSTGGATSAGAATNGGGATTSAHGGMSTGGKPLANAGSSVGAPVGTGGSTATSTTGTSENGKGCGCRVAGDDERPLGALSALLASGLGVVARRRTRGARRETATRTP